MSKPFLLLADIIHMTQQVGDNWAVAHAKRLVELVEQIGMDFPYDSYVMELAAYMHDWGAFPSYAQKDVEHARTFTADCGGRDPATPGFDNRAKSCFARNHRTA